MFAYLMDKVDIIPVKFNGTNYMTWSFHVKFFIEGQGMLGYLDGTTPKPLAVQSKDSTSIAST